MSDFFFPKLLAVEALEPYRLSTTWSTGEVLNVEVGDILRKHAELRPILEPEVFARVTSMTGAASNGWTPSLAQTTSTPGARNRPAKSAMKCLTAGCSAMICR